MTWFVFAVAWATPPLPAFPPCNGTACDRDERYVIAHEGSGAADVAASSREGLAHVSIGVSTGDPGFFDVDHESMAVSDCVPDATQSLIAATSDDRYLYRAYLGMFCDLGGL